MPFKLHEYNAVKFDEGCLAYLGKAENVAVTENLQQPHTLSFEYPMNDEKAELIQENRIVSVEGQAYRLTEVTREYSGLRMLKAKAERVFFIDARFHHIPTIGNDTDSSKKTIGVDPYVVIREAVKGTKFELIPDDELAEMGMTRIGKDGVKIDFFPTDKINTYDVITSVIEAIGYGEIYVDNYRIAVVERIGNDNGVRLSLKKNLTRLSVQRSIQELATRIYAYGADDLPITSVNKGLPYIDSPEGIAKYGIVEGYKDYSDYTEPEKVLAHAKWDLMGEDNDYRLDRPQLTITGDVVDLSKLAEYGDFYKIALGDTVRVYEDKIEHRERIINITYYPYSAKQPVVTIGVPTLRNMFYAAWQKGKLFKVIQKNRGRDNKLKTTYFTGTLNSTQNPVRSENKQLLLDGDLLYINDGSGKRRIDMGNLNKEFVFNLYDEDGNPVIHFDEHGNMIVTGTMRGGSIESDTDINVTKDAKIGRRIILQDKNEATAGYEEAAIISVSQGVMQILANNSRSINLHTDGNVNLNGKSIMVNGKEVATQSDLETIKNEIRQLWQAVNNNQ